MRYTMAVLSILLAVAACGDEPPPDCVWPKLAGIPATFCDAFPYEGETPDEWFCAWLIVDAEMQSHCYATSKGPYCEAPTEYPGCDP